MLLPAALVQAMHGLSFSCHNLTIFCTVFWMRSSVRRQDKVGTIQIMKLETYRDPVGLR